MRKPLLISIVIFIVLGCSSTINHKNLRLENGIAYKVNRKIPFTGKTVEYHKNGNIRSKKSFKDGKLNGESLYYYSNKNIASRNIFKNGKLEWEFIYQYYPNWNFKKIETYKDDQLYEEPFE